jgi:hypothetical protein
MIQAIQDYTRLFFSSQRESLPLPVIMQLEAYKEGKRIISSNEFHCLFYMLCFWTQLKVVPGIVKVSDRDLGSAQ